MQNPFEPVSRHQAFSLALGVVVLLLVGLWLLVGARAWWPLPALLGLIVVVCARPRYLDEGEPRDPWWDTAGPSI